jgi:hypothetical protein
MMIGRQGREQRAVGQCIETIAMKEQRIDRLVGITECDGGNFASTARQRQGETAHERSFYVVAMTGRSATRNRRKLRQARMVYIA